MQDAEASELKIIFATNTNFGSAVQCRVFLLLAEEPQNNYPWIMSPSRVCLHRWLFHLCFTIATKIVALRLLLNQIKP